MRRKIIWLGSAFCSGLLAALAFPKFNLSFFIWISLIPLLMIVFQSNQKRAFLAGWLAGLGFYGLLLYWIPYVPAHYGNLPLSLSLLIYFLLISFLALFWALYAWLQARIIHFFPTYGFVAAGFLWVSFEYILTFFLTGFPWGLLGYAQAQNLPLIQIASITGIYGVSFIIIFFSASFVQSLLKRKKFPFFFSLGLVLLLHLSGLIQLKKPLDSPLSFQFKAAVIQGNVSSQIYWDFTPEAEIEKLFDHHLHLTNEAIARGARLVIWPEFSVPLCFSCPEQRYLNFKKRLEKLVKETGVTLLLGTNERSSGLDHPEFYNTALCLSPDLSITTYYKMHLVPFGEYTPYKKIFSFIEKVTHAIGDVTPGKEHRLHSFQGLAFGSPICYEIIFPDLVRKFVKRGATFLVTITNDGWYGKSSAPYQHFQIALVRAIENRRYLLRSATTGISGIIDPFGRVIKRSSLMTVEVLEAPINPIQKMTFYTRFGDVWSWLCLTLSLLFVILTLVRKRNE
ncbi:MAG: apolipoprotein N-acyltransferase [Candidatus Aminicenantes bacterium]|nr:apolipoprotein N-acyltransferase [Candidatus Aminicenantes bacterium]